MIGIGLHGFSYSHDVPTSFLSSSFWGPHYLDARETWQVGFVMGLMGLFRASYGGLRGILSGLTESTDHASRVPLFNLDRHLSLSKGALAAFGPMFVV